MNKFKHNLAVILMCNRIFDYIHTEDIEDIEYLLKKI